MSDILWDKTVPPRVGSVVVARPRLTAGLSEGLAHNLILVSAPAGYGKSTLVASWLAELGSSVYPVWLSLEAGDADPGRFLVYLTAMVERVVPHLVEPIQAMMDAGDNGAGILSPAATHRLTLLLNTLASLDRHLVLVLDDYHLIGDCTIHRLLSFLISHLPPTVTVVIVTRVDPPLSLSRLRTQGRLTSVRAADLCFSAVEAGEFLRSVMGLDLSDESIEILTERTEGWISGLQLAALSLRKEQDVSGFLEEFAGDDRNIRSYLMEEVLAGQSPEIRRFLLVTSILERLTAPLCASLLEEIEGKPGRGKIAGSMSPQEILEYLEQRNLFIVPLDEHREWYRYHTLFAELLRFHLWSEQRDHLPGLRRRAATWLEQHGFINEAIRQAVALGDAALAGAIRWRSGRAGVNGTIGSWLTRFKQLSLVAFQRPAPELAANGHQFARGEAGRQALAGSTQKLDAPSPPTKTLPFSGLLCEQLSEREIEVLGLLAGGLSYREIGQRLFISLPTVKTHVSHIYGKLGVHNREAALERASELGLLRIQQHLR